jgi:DNA-directed RNA polymerase specialized sigma24 family protein
MTDDGNAAPPADDSRRQWFPATPRTVIADVEREGSGGHLARRIMELYREPLERYYERTSFRRSGPATDVVAGFFASRLSREGWLGQWANRHRLDGIPLRRWLMNGLNFYLQEEHRRSARDAHGGHEVLGLVASPAAELDFEREFARSLVRKAYDMTSGLCAEAGQDVHFEVFRRHVVEGRPYRDIGRELGLDEPRCGGMTRTVAAKFRRCLSDLLREDGCEPGAVDGEVARMMGLLA